MTTSTAQRCTVGLIVGLVFGVIGARFLLVASWLNLIPWSIIGAGLGGWARRMRDAALAGGAYGFGLSFAFMIAGYSGAASLASRLAPFALIGAVGAVCGATLAGVSASIVRRTRKR